VMVDPGAPEAGLTESARSALDNTRAVVSVELLRGFGSMSKMSSALTTAEPMARTPSRA
jgi:hypothetical protein